MNKILKVENLNKSFKEKKDELKIINDLNWELNEGDFVAVLGKSGSGKSTFLNLIGILDKADSGNIFLAGQEIKNLNDKERDIIRNKFLGFIFQFHYLLPEFTALENVMLPAMVGKGIDKEKIKKRAMDLLNDVELGERMQHKPSELSGGEKQRVAIARALINEPKILLADEPTGNLDGETSEVIHNILHKINKEKKQTIIVVTHSEELANVCKERVYLKKGKLEISR